MSLIPSNLASLVVEGTNVFDPFSMDMWDPFDGFFNTSAVANVPASASETS
ncbi:hypothetical protein Ddye_024872, partial [Dipteronia dyeriana]